jgi:hypothetical protein
VAFGHEALASEAGSRIPPGVPVLSLFPLKPRRHRDLHTRPILERRARTQLVCPPRIEERLAGVQEVLERRTERPALLLRALVWRIELEPTKGEIGGPYYVARTSLDSLALLASAPDQDGPDGGSSSLRWWRRRESNPTTTSPTPRKTRVLHR